MTVPDAFRPKEPDPRWQERLDRLTRAWTACLADAVDTSDARRLTLLDEELRAYTLAGWRARSTAAASPARSAPAPRTIGSASSTALPGDPGPASHLLNEPSGVEGIVSDAQRPPELPIRTREDSGVAPSPFPTAPRMIHDFCDATGISAEHLGGGGANLAAIAFYFRVFCLLTSDHEVSRERVTLLLRRLRHCREALNEFVAGRDPGRPPGPTPQPRRTCLANDVVPRAALPG